MKACLLAALVTVACVLGCPRPGAAVPVLVSVSTEGPNQFRVGLESTVRAPQKSVWNVLTDYDHHAQILPYMSKSRVVAKTSTSLTVEQEGRIRILFWTFTMRITQEVTEIPPTEMHFHAIAGDFERLEGTWHLSPNGGTTDLRCQFLVQPKRHVPEWAVRFTARHYLAAMVLSLQRHAEWHEMRGPSHGL
jgi:ribosome-associated toxin RatA of RatAB toxin-antitoxin module